MFNVKTVAIALIVSISSFSSHAAMTYGFGNNSCGQWTKERASKSMNSRYQEVWVLGFITGTGLVLEASGKAQKVTDSDAAMAYIDNYCRENPLSSIMEASQMLVFELMPSKSYNQ
ncbi:hypothetical protein CKO50_02770 [Pseudoalteromonas sp. HM-SA03]|uniref:hypothetical protein n=1 Tax=Pseudoalteromonas sp. HM-SA03 TaxID=2029678 RepID=UPI000BAE57C6|nr:hypothetical protein [Pseudoalteromonas sp. HM-SA03]PAY02909.1 hypothetical protein CKO50_02770 [Pseudoalteromonas sp. HM-SA03]